MTAWDIQRCRKGKKQGWRAGATGQCYTGSSAYDKALKEQRKKQGERR